jgi:hypothetical protein
LKSNMEMFCFPFLIFLGQGSTSACQIQLANYKSYRVGKSCFGIWTGDPLYILMAGSFGYICHKSNLFNRLVHLSFSLHMMDNL